MNLNPRSRYLLAGLGVYLLFVLFTWPAGFLSARLARHGIQSISTSGSIWHGQATGLRSGILQFGDLEWRIRFLPLLAGRLAADLKLTQPDGRAEARVSATLSGRIAFSNVSASLPLQTIVGSGGLPGGWVGTAQARFNELVFKNGWPIAAQGTLDVLDLTGPAGQPANLGAYRLQFSAANTQADAVTGSLEDLDSAVIDVAGTLKLAADRSYLLDTRVAARHDAPQNIARAMQYLGAPDAQGRRPFSVSGTF